MTEPIKLPLRDAIIEGMGWPALKGHIAQDDDLICRIERVVEQATADLRAELDIEFDNGRRQAEREWKQRLESMRAVAELYKEGYHGLLKMISKAKAMEPGCPVFLATPPQGSPPTRRPLTDEELTELARKEQLLLVCDDFDALKEFADALKEFARAIERAHKIGVNDD
jgi:hypothetical protein